MWALRRSSIHLKNKKLSSDVSRICGIKPVIPTSPLENNKGGYIEPQGPLFNRFLSSTRFYKTSSGSPLNYTEIHTFSSQADANSTEKDNGDLEEGFSELENPIDAIEEEDTSEDELTSELTLDSEVNSEENDGGERKSLKLRGFTSMSSAILSNRVTPVGKVLDKWVEEGNNEVTRTEVTLTMLHLRKLKLFVKALQLSEWLESTKRLDFLERDYASRLDLIAKTRGIYNAENYISQIPESFRGEVIYRTLLANCVSATNVKKSEEIFNKMKNLNFPPTCFTCNQLLLLYKRTDKKKISDVLLLMEKENVKPSLFTYQILIDVKGQANDISGMEQIVETMKSEGLKCNTQIQTSLARHYATSGLKDKSEAILKEMEGENIQESRWICRNALPIYASLKREDEVSRIWGICESNPRLDECVAAIEAWGLLRNIEKAEGAFEKMLTKLKKPTAKHFAPLLKVYADHKMLNKGKDLVKRMMESGCEMGPLTYDSVIRLYVGVGELEKADAFLEKASRMRKGKPMFISYLTVMEQYAERGDIDSAEKVFEQMRRVGYVSRIRQFQTLLKAYVKAKKPAYGFSERMKSDNVFPNRELAAQLGQLEAFKKVKKSELDELLD